MRSSASRFLQKKKSLRVSEAETESTTITIHLWTKHGHWQGISEVIKEEISANEPETESRQQSQWRPGQSLSRENDYGGDDQGDCDKHNKNEKFCMTFLL